MKQYEIKNVSQVAHKIAELTNTKIDKECWKEYCSLIKNSGGSDTVDYIALDENDEPYDVSIFLGYSHRSRHWYVGVEE